MLKMGIQRQAIGQKMLADEIPSDVIAIFKAGPKGNENGGEGTGGDGAASGTAGGAAGREWKKGGNQQGRNNSRKPSMRQIQWNTLDKDRAEKSVFGTGSQISAVVPAAVQTDERLRLQELFGTTDATASAAGAGGGGKKKKKARVAVVSRVSMSSVRSSCLPSCPPSSRQSPYAAPAFADRQSPRQQRIDHAQAVPKAPA